MFSSNRLKYFATSLLICLISVKAISLLTYHVLKPALTSDLHAYQLLCRAGESPDLAEIQMYSKQAARVAIDEDLKKLADFISRTTTAALNNGVTTISEGKSLTGIIKSYLSMRSNPSSFVDAAALAIEGILIDYEKIADQVDARYKPILQKDHDAMRWSKAVFWYALAVGLFVTWKHRPPKIAAASQVPHPTHQAPDLITCPSCGSRNRNHPVAPGQKLVCGQCKTVLLSV